MTGYFSTVCMDSISSRSDDHPFYVCGKPVGHLDAHEDVIRGAEWTDATHYDRLDPDEPSALQQEGE